MKEISFKKLPKGIHPLKEDTIFYKKIKCTKSYETFIVQILAPKGTLLHKSVLLTRSSVIHKRKLRIEHGYVLAISPLAKYTGPIKLSIEHTGYHFAAMRAPNLKYTIGEKVVPNGFSPNLGICKKGLHVFASLMDARRY